MIAAIVQARMGSTRMPGKVLYRACGKTFLEHLIERLRYCRLLDDIIVATSNTAIDDCIQELCAHLDTHCFRGNEKDVLDRYYQAARCFGVKTIVRITADCPLVDPEIVGEFIKFARQHEGDYDLVTNRHPLTFPDGLDVDVMPLSALETAWRSAGRQEEREHVIPYFWNAGLRIKNIEHPENLFRVHRWTVDYKEDAELVKAIFEGLYSDGQIFGMHEILDFLNQNPALADLNSKHLPHMSTS
jgi:spore coat polysaccharide biosynthesis protein SpsF